LRGKTKEDSSGQSRHDYNSGQLTERFDSVQKAVVRWRVFSDDEKRRAGGAV